MYHFKLINDSIINVAQLLKQPVGASRTLEIHLDRFNLDEDLLARGLEAGARLTRIETGILTAGTVRGVAQLVCVRCLGEFEQPFDAAFDAEFRPSIDIQTGDPLPLPDDDDLLVIDNNHQLDLGELLRQVTILALPMRPVCGDQCPGFQSEFASEEDAVDDRLAVLRSLLDDSAE